MSAESPNSSTRWDCAKQALAEIRACPGELQTFVTGLFEEFGKLVDELLAHELGRQQIHRTMETERLQDQIDRLAAVVASLAGTVPDRSRQADVGGEKDAIAAAVDETFCQGDSRPVVQGDGIETAPYPIDATGGDA